MMFLSLKKYSEGYIWEQKLIMNNYVTEAINLKSYNLNEADKIIVIVLQRKLASLKEWQNGD